MITTTAQELIDGAWQDMGVLSLGQALTGAEAEDALDLLNLVLDGFEIDPPLLFTLVRTTLTLTSGTSSYTVGAAGNIVVARPSRIAKAGLILDTAATTPTEMRLDILSDDEYAAWPQKTFQASHSRAIFYDRRMNASGYGVLYPLPIPNVGTTQLAIYTHGGRVAAFAALATEYNAAEGLALVLRTQLAQQALSLYPQAKLSDRYIARAAYLKRTFHAAHLVVPKRTNTPMVTGGGGVSDSEFDSGLF